MYDYNEMRKELLDVRLIADKKLREELRVLLKEAIDSGDPDFVKDVEDQIIIAQIEELMVLHESLSVQHREGMWSAEDNAGETLKEIGIDKQSLVGQLLFYRMSIDIDTILTAQAEADM